jgi:hypothetical protein
MISQKSISELTLIGQKYSKEQLDANNSIGWFEDNRKEEKYTYKCPKGDFPLTKGLQEGNKAQVTTHMLPIKINDKIEIREVRFHDHSIIEILSNELGYAKYKIHSYSGKARYIKLKTSICPSIEACISDYNIKNEKINMEKENNIDDIIEKCIKNNLIKNNNNELWLNNDLDISVKIWCEMFSHFKNEEKVFSQKFYSKDGLFLEEFTVKCYIENERNKLKYDNWLKMELAKSRKSNAKLYKNKIKEIKL